MLNHDSIGKEPGVKKTVSRETIIGQPVRQETNPAMEQFTTARISFHIKHKLDALQALGKGKNKPDVLNYLIELAKADLTETELARFEQLVKIYDETM
ncbi:DUF5388 domain-containing protein [Ligilactobacillus equi]